MKLFFDARYIRTDFHDGISRYSCELGNAIDSNADITYIIHDLKQLKFLPNGAKYIKIHKPTSIKEPLTSILLNKHNPDVVFSPMQTIGAVGKKFKLILTLHDMIYYRNPTPPKQFNPLIRIGWRVFHSTYLPQRIILNGADAVATVSDTSKKDIQAAKLTKRNISVITNAPRNLHESLDGEIKNTNPKNLVYIGSFMDYKNVETLIRGMSSLPEYKLYLLGPIADDRKAELIKLIPKQSEVIFYGGVNNTEYAKILANNAILVTASRDEGFGLPVAEALQFGIPAVISDIEIFHEVAGDGALYFNPTDPRDFADKVKQLEDGKLRENLVAKGKTHIARFNWKKSANNLIELARQLHQN